jgi:hypothetical protein
LRVPAFTDIAAPLVTALPFDEGEVLSIEIVIPDGCAGLVGFAFRQSQQQVIPFGDGTWIIGNDEVIRWPTEGYPTGAKWAMVAYNTDLFPHILQTRFLMNETSMPAPLTPTLIPIL